jgi:secreted PhoX family phosphatase
MTEPTSPAAHRGLPRRALLAAAPLLAAHWAAPAHAQRRAAASPAQAPRPDDVPAAGWRRDVLIRWGDRVEFDAPKFQPGNPTDIAAATQFGWDATVLGALPAPSEPDDVPRLVLAVAHPSAEARMLFPGGHDRPALAGLAQGASILTLERRGGRWRISDGGFHARRLTARTRCRLAGPVTPQLGDAAPGVLAVGGGCATPWGTVLLAEGDPAPWFDRLASEDDLYADPAARALYGWMVELDPLDPQALPVKRTALGRFARAGAAATLAADGRAVVFMTDPRAAGFLFRFVSADPVAPGSFRANRSPLDNGTLAVARSKPAPAEAAGMRLNFVDLPENPAGRSAALAAAAAAGATAFDSPRGLVIGADRTLHLACRGTASRTQPDAFNPRAANAAGHVLAFHPEGEDVTAADWTGEIVLLGGNPAEGGGVTPEGSRAWLAAPCSVGRDAAGRLWIGTDQQGVLSATADGLFVATPPGNALAAAYFAPRGAAIGGAVAVGDTVFTAVRHPGAEPGASFDRPGTRWPGMKPDTPPQTALVALTPTA